MTASDAEVLIVRPKSHYDGAIPSGNSVSVMNLLRLGHLTGEQRYEERADSMMKAFSSLMPASDRLRI